MVPLESIRSPFVFLGIVEIVIDEKSFYQRCPCVSYTIIYEAIIVACDHIISFWIPGDCDNCYLYVPSLFGKMTIVTKQIVGEGKTPKYQIQMGTGW